MFRGSLRRAIVAAGVLTITIGTLSAIGPAADAARPGPSLRTSTRSGAIHLVRSVGPIAAIAKRAQARVATRSAGTAESPLDPEIFRARNSEGQELEGGDAVAHGEVPAPVATHRVGVSGTSGTSASFEALNHFDSRYNDKGNQFSGEPPDQGLCVSKTREFEIVNDAVQVYNTNGHALIAGQPAFPGTAPVGISLNQFFGVPSAFVRPAGPFGPFIYDVSCLYDRSERRWFALANWLATNKLTGDLTGPAGYFLAVSRTSKPLGTWNVFSVNTTNNGTNGTPNHHCSSGFCFGDYPHMAINRSAVVVTTNEFDNLGAGEFHAAQLYAISKAGLVAGVASPTMATVPNIFSNAMDDTAYTVQPVDSLPADWVGAHKGTLYLAMSQAPYADATAHGVSLWRLTGTNTLNGSPHLKLEETSVPTDDYASPPHARQMAGDTPLLNCENDPTCIGQSNPFQVGPWPLDAADGTVTGAWLHHGVVYLVMGDALAGSGGALVSDDGLTWSPIPVHAGVFYVGLKPSLFTNKVWLQLQGSTDVSGQNLIYPSIAMNASGKGAIGATFVGPNVYPSAAYVPFSTAGVTGPVQVAGAGVGPNDGFTATFDGAYQTRWGDYGAATVAPGGRVWLASEYIDQTCDDATFAADPTCGFTRTFFANWSTRLYAFTP
ncbi:MAG TPA: hypothetical protein VK646_13120 [Actinomycetota bacterium]|nr:hypothetical protein [Actinomycetota bacterium]